MIVLGFDTATAATAVGLRLTDGTTLQARDDPEDGKRPGHATRLLPLADGLLAEAGLAWGDLERIAVGVGPGTFTGLRIGVATARGLAQSLGVGLVGVSSLRALAHALAANPMGDSSGALATIDARRGEVFVAAYLADAEIVAPLPLAPQGLGGMIEQARAGTGVQRWVAVGDGALRYREELERGGAIVPDDGSRLHRVDAESVCALGELASVEDIATVVPDYLRRPDAELALQGAPR